jgi:hypothetical protein
MFSEGNIYLRQIAARTRRGLLVRGVAMYEVLTGPGVTRFVTRKYLGGAVGYDPRGSRRDMQEAQATARRLFDEGRRGEWVHYPTAGIVAGESLRTD